MRLYRLTAATPHRTIYGAELVAGLGLFPETTPLVVPFEKLNEQLDEHYEKRRSARKPMVKKRAALRVTSWQMRQELRSTARAAEIADGGRRGPTFKEVFPDGTSNILNHKLAAQTGPAKGVVDRLTKSQLPGIDAFRNACLPKLTVMLTKLQAASDDFRAARDTYNDLFETELAMREQHRREVDALMGKVRAAYPSDKTKQDVVFPELEDDDDDSSSAKKKNAKNAKPTQTTTAPQAATPPPPATP